MTGLHYIIKESPRTHNGMRVFKMHRSDETYRQNVFVYLDDAGVTHCGGCTGPLVAMQRNCKHCDAVHRFVVSQMEKRA